MRVVLGFVALRLRRQRYAEFSEKPLGNELVNNAFHIFFRNKYVREPNFLC